MKKLSAFWESNKRLLVVIGLVMLALGSLLLYKLGSLNKGGLSHIEWQAITSTYGWQGIYTSPLYLPIKLIRSVVYTLGVSHNEFVTRLPNAILGGITIGIFGWLIRLWHGNRTAILSTILFATSAWVLHVSRLASFDILYLMLIPALLLSVAALQRHATKPLVYYGSLLLWGSLLYVPGAVWLIVLTVYWERKAIKQGWNFFNSLKQRFLYVVSGLIWFPLLIIELIRPDMLKIWLGIPDKFNGPGNIILDLWDVIFSLLVHGPDNAAVWLRNAPIFDIFTLIIISLGIYFYAKHRKVGRTRILLSYFIVGAILTSFGGGVGLSIVIPILYICAATGIAFLIHEWLKVFPINPFARIIGIGLIALAISLSSSYNLRAYFIAWPNNTNTQTTFHYKQ